MEPVALVADNVNLVTRVNGNEMKHILTDVTLVAKPGELTAIMGPSGSGKTSLLNIIAARTRNKLRPSNTSISLADKAALRKGPVPSGQIYLNGNPVSCNDMKVISKYVMQTDCLMPFLTVEETIKFGANLKLTNVSRSQRLDRVEEIISQLGLHSCRHVNIGNNIRKGISGGQKKRVAIALELLENPALIFLDEPTSGLDSSLAFDVLQVVNLLAKQGKTIVATIHQPRQQIFNMFDRLHLLSLGKTVYQGPASELKAYWSDIGYPVPKSFTVADYSLDILTVTRQSENDMPTSKMGSFGNIFSKAGSFLTPHIGLSNSFRLSSNNEITKSQKYDAPDTRRGLDESTIRQIPDMFEKSVWYSRLRRDVEEGTKRNETVAINYFTGNDGPRSPIRLISNFGTLAHRQMINTMRDWPSLAVQTAVTIIMGIISGAVFYKVEQPKVATDCSQFFNTLGIVAFSTINQSFMTLQTWIEYPLSRPIFNRERAGALYSTPSYFLSLVISNIPFMIVIPFVHTLSVYFLAGLGNSVEDFMFYWILGIMMTWAAGGWAMLSAMVTDSPASASALAPIGCVVAALLSGFWITEDALPKFWNALKFVSWMRYGINGYFRLRFNDIGVIDNCASMPNRPSPVGNLFVAFGIGCFWRFLACLALLLTNTRLGLE